MYLLVSPCKYRIDVESIASTQLTNSRLNKYVLPKVVDCGNSRQTAHGDFVASFSPPPNPSFQPGNPFGPYEFCFWATAKAAQPQVALPFR
jgi:hypothetical protein